MRDWDTPQVVEWLTRVYANKPNRAAKLIKVIVANDYDGGELLAIETEDGLAKALNTTESIASLFKEIQAFKSKLVDDAVDEAANAMPESELITKNMSTIKTEEDLQKLIEMFRDVFDIKGDDEKEEISCGSDEAVKSYKKMIEEVTEMASDFVKSLVGIKLKETVTEKIIKVCFQYRKLLRRTATAFGEYSSEIKHLEQLMHQISYTFSLPSMVMETINGMDDKNKQTAITKLRKQTASQLKSSTKKFSDNINAIQTHHIPTLKELSVNWSTLTEDITALLDVIDASGDAQKHDKPLGFVARQMTRLQHFGEYSAGFLLKWIAMSIFFAVTVASASSACTGAAMGGITVSVSATSPLGVIAGGALIVGAAASACGLKAAICRGANAMIEEGDKMMNHTALKSSQFEKQQQQIARTKKNKSQIEMMRTALEHMSIMSEIFANMIDSETRNFRKIKDNDPLKQLNGGGFGDSEINAMLMDKDVIIKIQLLGSTILRCTECLKTSRANIDLVEITCANERNNFGDKILKPLIYMLKKKGKYAN